VAWSYRNERYENLQGVQAGKGLANYSSDGFQKHEAHKFPK